MVEPQISVIAQSPLLMGRKAAQRLFARIRGEDRPGQRIVMPTGLRIRSTSRRADWEGAACPQ
jgi:LacI family transcriptional regulator